MTDIYFTISLSTHNGDDTPQNQVPLLLSVGAMASVVVCGLMCSIIKCVFCLGAYLTENPHDNHGNYVRY